MIGPEELLVFGISAEVIAKALGDLYLEALKDKAKGALAWLKNEEKAWHEIHGAARQYVKSYAERHGQVKVLGMSEPLPLTKLYTAVRFLDPSEIHRYATPENLENLFREHGRRRLQSRSETVDGLELANDKPFLMVLGQPGAGKTTFLRRTGLEALKGKQGRYRHRMFPVLLELRRYPDGKLVLDTAIAQELGICGFPDPEEATRRLLDQGRLLLLLDGLDEVPGQHQDAVIDHIQDFVDRHANNRFIASCRTAAYHSRFRRFTDVLMADFSDAQIEHFIQRWFSSERDLEAQTAKRCWETLNDAGHAAAKELAQNPLLLTLLCLVFEDGQCFPANRAILYGEALEVLLKKWAAEKRIHRDPIYRELTLPLEKIMLGRLAHDFFQANRLFFRRPDVTALIAGFLAENLNAPKHLDGDTVLKAIEIQQGILVARDHSGGVLSFSHLTFQEYLTAQHLADHGTWEGAMGQCLTEDRWREVFLLTAGQARPNANGFLRAMARRCCELALACPSLVALFRCADSVTSASPGAACPAAKRVAVIALVLIIVSATAGRLRYAIDPAIVLVQDLAHDFLPDLSTFRSLSNDRADEVARDLAHDLPPVMEYLGFFNRPVAIPDVGHSWKNYFGPLFENLGIPGEILGLWRARNEVATCLKAYGLLLDCKAAALAVSPAAWAEIEAGLFLVDDPAPPSPLSGPENSPRPPVSDSTL